MGKGLKDVKTTSEHNRPSGQRHSGGEQWGSQDFSSQFGNEKPAWCPMGRWVTHHCSRQPQHQSRCPQKSKCKWQSSSSKEAGVTDALRWRFLGF